MNESRSLSTQLAALGVEPVTFRALQDLNPGANSNSLMMILRYCQAAKLDPLRQPVTILPIDGKQVPVLSINGLRAHAARTGQYAGGRCEYSDALDEIDGLALPVWATYTVQRIMPDGSRAEFAGTVFAREAIGRKRNGQITRMWQTRGMHMLSIAAERLALRRAFPESVPPDDAPARQAIDPNTGEIHGQAPRYLSDEDIAFGLESIDGADLDALDGDFA